MEGEREVLDYEFEGEEEENIPPSVEGLVSISDDEDPILDLDTSTSLQQQPEWAEAVEREKRALRLLNLKARLGPPPTAAGAPAAPAAGPAAGPAHNDQPPAARRLAMAKSGRIALPMAAKPLTPAQRKAAEQRKEAAKWRLRRL